MFRMKPEISKLIKRKMKMKYISEKTGLSLCYLSLIFSSKRTCPLSTAESIAKIVTGKDNIKYDELDQYFTREK